MARIIRFVRDRHAEAQMLLPWLATGRLDEDERARVEAHLRDCAECRADLRLERGLAGAFAELPYEADNGWMRMRARIAAEPQRGRFGARLRQALAAPGRTGWALAVQFILVAAALVVLLPPWRPAAYHALSAAKPPAPGDLIVVFRPDARAEEVTRSLRAVGARLVDGPTAADAYVLDVPDDRRAAAVAQLRSDAAVSLAEPLDRPDAR
jgi:hypothetical protein